jgi:hypothetical protein
MALLAADDFSAFLAGPLDVFTDALNCVAASQQNSQYKQHYEQDQLFEHCVLPESQARYPQIQLHRTAQSCKFVPGYGSAFAETSDTIISAVNDFEQHYEKWGLLCV